MENTERNYDLIVVGGGPAGMAAAIRAAEEGVEKIAVLERAETLGGILEQCIHTGFGLHYFGEELSGPEYAARFIELLKKTKVEVKLDTMVLNVAPCEGKNTVTAVSAAEGLVDYRAKAVILAMGCRERPRGAIGIAGTRPAGIMTAGTAQKYVNVDGFMPGRKIVILGSGDIGLIMARRMTLEGAEVKVVCELMPYSSGLQRNIVQCLEDFGIPLRLSCTVVKVHGKDHVEGVTIADVDENRRPIPSTEQYIECDTLLLSVGLIPENELSRAAGLAIDPVTSGPVVDQDRETECRGIFACGNVLHVHDLVDYVTGESQIAGAGAAKYIKGIANEHPEYIRTKGVDGVRYIVPQRLDLGGSEDVKLYFRVGKVYRNAHVRVTCGDRVILDRKKPKLAPGEMENVTIRRDVYKDLDRDCDLVIGIAED